MREAQCICPLVFTIIAISAAKATTTAAIKILVNGPTKKDIVQFLDFGNISSGCKL